MAQQITVNVGAAGKEVQSYRIITGVKGGKPVHIIAKNGVNYELIDEATGLAPEAIATRRNGKDLVVSFEGKPEEPELVIENYYTEEPGVENGANSVLVGQYNDGQFYAYVPDSSQAADAVSLLADEVSTTQVLGGESLSVHVTPPATALIVGGTILAALAAGAGGGGGGEAPPPPKPEAGTLNAPKDTNDNTPTITGKGATPGAEATVLIKDQDGKVVDTVKTTVKPDGTYQVTPTKPIPDGPYTAEATVTKDGQSDTAKDTGSVDTTPPDAPATVITDNVGTVTGPIKNGDSTDDTTPTINGKGEPGAKVEVVIDGGAPVTTTVNPDGTWSIPDPTLKDGEHTVSVTQTDKAGNTSTPPTETTFTVDTAGPKVQSITMDDTALKIGDTSKVTITFDEKVQGFDVNDLTVENGTLSGLTSADGGKTWTGTFTPTANIEDATNVISVKAGGYTDTAGNPGAAFTGPNYAIDTQAPTVDKIAMDDPDLKVGETATITIVFSEPVTGFDASDINAPYGTLGTPTTTDGGKTWTVPFTPNTGTSGSGTISIKDKSYTDLAENPGAGGSGSEPVEYTVDTKASGATIQITAIDEDTGTDKSDFKTSDTSLTVSGTLSTALLTGEKVQVSNDGGETWTDATVSGKTWSLADGTTHTAGTFTYTARVVNNAGTPTATAEKLVEIDTGFPSQTVTISTVVDDYLPQPGGVSGNVDVANGGLTNDTTPLVKGKLDEKLADGSIAGSTAEHLEVWVSVNGAEATKLGNAEVTGTNWSYQDTTGYTHGDKVVYTAKVVDAVDNKGAVSNSYAIELDTQGNPITGAPNPGDVNEDPLKLADSVEIEAPVPGSNEFETVLVFNSRGERIDTGATIDKTTDPSGQFWYVDGLSPELKVGETLTVRTIDAAGNISKQSDFEVYSIGTGVSGKPLPKYTIGITEVIDDSTGSDVALNNGDSTNDLSLVLSGSMQCTNIDVALTGMDPGNVRVALYDNGNYIGDATVVVSSGNSNGTWTFNYDSANTPAEYVAGSAHKFEAKVIFGQEGVFNESVMTSSDSFTAMINADARGVTVKQELVGSETYLKVNIADITAGDVLQFKGEANDVLDIGLATGTGWIDTGTASGFGDGATYHVLQHYDGSAYIQMLVQDGITII